MQYLESFTLASADAEVDYILSFHYKLEMQCFSGNVYPFKIFPEKGLSRLDFAPITVIYGSNGSGKSTLLNIIAEKLSIARSAPFNNTPYFEEYLKKCDYSTVFSKKLPRDSRIITSDDVFDFLLDIRSLNEGIDRRREELFDEYTATRKEEFRMQSLSDYEELKRHNEAKSKTKSVYVTKRLQNNLSGRSNGESAFAYFTQKIPENALCLLDEPENSLSVKLQSELSKFVADSARFFGTQFIISTHSPFFLSLAGAKVYDLDSLPVCVRRWTELENVKIYRDFFRSHADEFDR